MLTGSSCIALMKNQRAAAAAASSAVGFTCSFLPTMFFLVSFIVLAKPHNTLVIDIKTGDSSFRSSSDRHPTEKEQPAHGGDTGHGYLKATPYPHPPKKRNAHAFFWPPHYEKSFSVVGHKETWKHKRYSKESSRRLLSTAHSKRGHRPNASRTREKASQKLRVHKETSEPCQFDLSSLTVGKQSRGTSADLLKASQVAHNVIRKTLCGGGLPYWCVAFWGLFRDWTRKRQKRRRERKMPTSFNDSLPLLTGICMPFTSIRQRELMEQPARGRPCSRSRPTNSTADQAGTHACASYQTRKGQHITPSSSTPGAPPAFDPKQPPKATKKKRECSVGTPRSRLIESNTTPFPPRDRISAPQRGRL